MNSIEPKKEIASWRCLVAGLFSAGALLFTILWLAICAFVMLQIIGQVYEGGELVFAGIFLTAPPVFICTIGALLLVGPKRCKLAWMSALFYFSPVIVALILAAIGAVFGLGKP